MNKKIWTAIGASALLAATALPALAAETGEVTATVTPQLVSLTITTDGSVAYGTLASNASQNTVSLGETQTVQNNGNVNEDFRIKSSDAVSAGTDWDLAATTGVDQYVHQFSIDSGVVYGDFPVDNEVTALLVSPVPANSSQSFDLKITTPTESTNTDVHEITVTVVASAT